MSRAPTDGDPAGVPAAPHPPDPVRASLSGPMRTAADDGPLPALLDRLSALARRVETPCGTGAMAWRCWGHGRPLVLLHGGGGSWEHWVRNIGPLSRVRQVWCPDLPAYGESDSPPEPFGVDEIAAITAQGLDRVLPGTAPVDLAGFSFGGIVGTALAWQRPGRVRRLVLVGAAALGLERPGEPLQPWYRASDPAERRAMHEHNLRALMVASPQVDPDAVTLHARSVERARFNGRTVAGSTQVRDRLGALQVDRVDAIYGALDPITHADTRLAGDVLQAQRPDLRLATLDAAGHWAQYERPAAFEAALLGMLET
jgi:2-hydroxy-6-oxonona-2,4-dienedioate hydrolase